MGELSQSALNTEMQTLGVGRYRNKVESARQRDAEIETNYGQRLMRGVLPEFTKGIEDWKNTVAFYDRKARYQIDTQNLDAKVIGYISIKAVLDSITKNRPLAQVGIYLGARVEDELRCRFLLENNDAKAKGILLGAKKRKGEKGKIRHVRGSMAHEVNKGLMPEWQKWSIRDKLNMGVNMIELLRSTTGIIEYVYILKTRGKKPVRYVSATQELLEWIEKYNEDRELLEPFWLPTVETPLPWKNVFEGGFDTEGYHLPKLPFIKTTDMPFLRGIKGELYEPMEAVNLIQQTPWRVNDKVLDTMKWAWDNNLSIGELPNRKDEEFPPIPTDFKTDAIVNRDWRREAAKIYELNLSTKSRRMLVAKTLHLAEKFRGERFFMPHQCDFRGRVYSIPSFLNIQSADYSRGLLHFARPEKIKNKQDAKWLAIHGANTWGNDKVSLADREQWAYDFSDTAIKIADNPTLYRDYEYADKSWQFLAWCFEWAEYIREGKINTHLPVAMDATNNGLQILSLLMRDEEGGKSTNVMSTPIPEDIYRDVADKVNEYLLADTESPYAKTWYDFGIDRSTLKRVVMVFPYGGTFYSCRAYIDEWYQDTLRKKQKVNPFTENDRYKVTGYLAKLAWKAVHDVLDKPTQCMNWLRECASIVAKDGHAIEWETPTGFPVKQSYFGFTNQEVKTSIGGSATYVSFRKEDAKISVKKAKQGISPNFVHSLDASLLTKSVIAANKEAGVYDFAMIHDSYGTHSTKCEEFSRLLRNECYKMFKNDLLEDFVLQLQTQYPHLAFPLIPEYGTLDASDVKGSQYFFS